MSIKISIIVPIYNVEKYIHRCIQSLLSQTYENIEIILIDDGSTDNCPNIINEYKKEDLRIKVIHKSNGGLSDARNVGLDVATGDFITFVDSDDYIDLDLCSKVSALIDDDVDIIAYNYCRVYDDHIEEVKSDFSARKYNKEDIFKIYLKRREISHMVCDKMFRRKLFNDVRFIKNRLAEDVAICYKLIGKARNVILYNDVLYFYYTRVDSIMGLGSLKLCVDAYKGECENFEFNKSQYPQFMSEINTRFLNQSMKTYLKLIKRFNIRKSEKECQDIMLHIKNINKKNIGFDTKVFYYIFSFSKSIAWVLFEFLKLT